MIFDKCFDLWIILVNFGFEFNIFGDELFFIFVDNGDLYFVFDGFFGMGGLDIFCVEKVGSEMKW